VGGGDLDRREAVAPAPPGDLAVRELVVGPGDGGVLRADELPLPSCSRSAVWDHGSVNDSQVRAALDDAAVVEREPVAEVVGCGGSRGMWRDAAEVVVCGVVARSAACRLEIRRVAVQVGGRPSRTGGGRRSGRSTSAGVSARATTANVTRRIRCWHRKVAAGAPAVVVVVVVVVVLALVLGGGLGARRISWPLFRTTRRAHRSGRRGDLDRRRRASAGCC